MRRRMIGGQTVSNGIYILHINGKLYTRDKWNYSWRNDAVGVALISDNSSFVISGIEIKNRSWSNTTGLIQGVTTITSSNEAKKDFNGFQNTQRIDNTCIKVSQKHFPDIIRLGDVNNWRTWDIPWKDIDLVMGGFCCQSFSSSGKGKGFMDARGRLFFCFSDIVRHLKKETKGKILFLGENVRMRDEHRRVITEELGVEPVEIDSALVSAQTRHRLYWCNWPVEMPKDKHISLDDVLENDKGWKSGTIRGRYISTIVGRRIDSNGHRKDYDKNVKIIQCLEVRKDKNTTSIKKSNCLTTVMKDNVISSLPPGRYLNAFDLKDKFRYLTPVEMCRLQTLPDDYLDGIAPNTAMSLAGNGWTVDVIAHLLRGIERR